MINFYAKFFELATLIEKEEELSDVRMCYAFDIMDVPLPLGATLISAVPGKVEVNPNYFETEESTEPCWGVSAEFVLRFHADERAAPYLLHNKYLKVVDLMTNKWSMKVLGCECGDVSHDRDTNSLVMTARVRTFFTECPGEVASNTQAAASKTYFCENHIANPDYHLTTEERAWLNEPFVTGTYEGNGEGTRDIELGFKPKTLLIFPRAYPIAEYHKDDDELFFYLGYGNNIGRTRGLSFTSTGFSIKMTDAQKMHGFMPRYNENGVTYLYTAFK